VEARIHSCLTQPDRGEWIVSHPTNFPQRTDISNKKGKKVKAVLLQVWSDPEGSRKLRLPDLTMVQDWGKIASLEHQPPLPSGNAPGTHFC